VRRRREQNQRVAGLGNPLGQAVPLRNIVCGRVVGEMVDLIAHDDVEADILNLAKRPIPTDSFQGEHRDLVGRDLLKR
jgi:hypothetical protein